MGAHVMRQACDSWERVYRLRPYFRNLGIVATSFDLSAWIGSVLLVLLNIDGIFTRPALAIAFFSVFWGGFTLLGIWLIVAYFRYRLFLNEDAICHVGVLQTKKISLDTVEELKWRLVPPGGSCIVQSVGTRIKVEFRNFTEPERTELISFLRERVRLDRQTNWDSFHDQLVVPSPEATRRRELAHYMVLLGLLVYSAFIGAAWRAGLRIHYLVLSVLTLLVGLWALLVRAWAARGGPRSRKR